MIFQIIFGVLGTACLMVGLALPKLGVLGLGVAAWFFYWGLVMRDR